MHKILNGVCVFVVYVLNIFTSRYICLSTVHFGPESHSSMSVACKIGKKHILSPPSYWIESMRSGYDGSPDTFCSEKTGAKNHRKPKYLLKMKSYMKIAWTKTSSLLVPNLDFLPKVWNGAPIRCTKLKVKTNNVHSSRKKLVFVNYFFRHRLAKCSFGSPFLVPQHLLKMGRQRP